MRILAIAVVFFPLLSFAQPPKESTNVADLKQLDRMIARFSPTPIQVDTSQLSPGDKQALVKVIEASRLLNHLFMDQLWSQDWPTWEQVKAATSPLGKARAHYYWINKSPWSALDEEKAFLPGVPERKPLGANFYPENMSKEEFESWVRTLPPNEQQEATGFFTVIRRDAKGKLMMVPYSEEYKSLLEPISRLLKAAANETDNATLKRFLNLRAEALLSNDYYESDVAWMDLDAPLEVTLGPYETYNDELFNYKAAFESYVTLRDEAESNKLNVFAKHLQEIENHLPEDPKFRNPKLGAAAPIRVVNSVFSAGDGDHGVQTAAYNLPNDERVVQEKGAKRVMLKNIQEAKFNQVLLPIADRVLLKQSRADVAFEPFFTHIVAHELMHGLGPQQIEVNGKKTSPRQQLKELYAPIEEAKADATGLFALQYMMDHAKPMNLGSVLPTGAKAEHELYTTFLASAFRSLRFGIVEAHGKGMAMQFNFLLDRGGFVRNPDATYSVDDAKIKGAVRDLTHELLTLEANGDYAAARKELTELAVIRPETQQALDQLKGIPVDIEPQYVTADQLVREHPAKATAEPAKAASK